MLQQLTQQQKILAAALAVILLVGGAFLLTRPTADMADDTAVETAMVETAENSTSEADAAKPVAPVVTSNAGALDTPNPMGEIVLGDANAPVTIVEYSSLTCPHCGAFHRDTLPKLKAQYIDSGQVKIYFRPFPFDPYATAGAMLAQCVAPKARVNFLDLLFKRQQQWIQSEKPMDALLALSRQAGLSEADFVVCLKDESKLEAIRQMQAAAADELGVRSTPTFFVNGEKIEGNRGLDAFDKVIKPLLP